MPSFGDEIIFTQGSVKERRFAAAYGRRGRIVGAVTFNHGKWLDYYEARSSDQVRSRRLPPGSTCPPMRSPMPADFPAGVSRRDFPTSS